MFQTNFNNKFLWASITALVVVPYYKCDSITRQENDGFEKNNDVGYVEEVGHCLRDGGAVSSCLAAGAFVMLEAASQKRSVSLADDLQLYENDVDSKEPRTPIFGEDGDPTDFHSLMEASTKFLQRRTLRWSLESLYPGLEICVGPGSSGPPILQFLLDPRRGPDDRRLSTGRLLVKRAVLPYILGLKLNLVTIIPLVFAALVFLTKKAFLLSKFAFLFTTMVGMTSISHFAHNPPLIHPATSGYGGYGYHDGYLKDYNQPFRNRDDTSGRNIVWEERDKKLK